MKLFHLQTILILSILILGCKKKLVEQPANAILNSENLDCTTCPSTFYDFESIPEMLPVCEDFETFTWVPQGDTLGYSESGQYPILDVPYFAAGPNGFWLYNQVGTPGIYGITSGANFSFDGSEQTIRFEIYAFYAQYNQMGFSINGSAPIDLSQTFPMTIGNVLIELDTTLTNVGLFENAYLKFTGDINNIEIYCFESGISDLCITKSPSVFTPNQTGAVYFDAFYDYDGTELGNHPNEKTPMGYYGVQPAVLNIDFKAFLGYDADNISFVHAYPTGSSDLLNVKLPNTPLIITSPDSLEFYLSPYNYEVEHYVKQNQFLWQNNTQPPLTGATADSIVIKGQNLTEIIIGAEMNHSEIRSICAYFE